ncbi:P-loop containing nucleoside triphosphate hydrolase protein [Sporormia fimetaria CBS 119925]|uniref:Ribosome-releasing factor 2, mitochondrial n=1 Tax=Sporormia fimetaria CBS 119925 TaxID=1340428 RepID=A0A6A6UYR2_9PLEO|nr:P-loop containing nucleoside triphosphate hydrolase protein [Sporormia fimetaria CBS 119925]
MRFEWVWRSRRALRYNVTARRLLATQVATQQLSKTRNIGIIAHIDAGKTTTTERMLYYSGYTRRIGDVDEGSTVTDFLPAERARGITIQSAAITFDWPPKAPNQKDQDLPTSFDVVPRSSISHNVNLIDTPGHADFTFEVLRSLRVLDGAVCILDGVAGVEAQTEKVWTQAGTYQIPRIIFVNKLDRVGAAFSRTVKEIGVRLHVWPAVCQIPWFKGGDGDFFGVGDAVNLRGMLWQGASDGREINAFSVRDLEKTDASFAEEIKKARVALVELLSEHDDTMVELFFEHDEDHLAIPGFHIVQALRRVVNQTPQTVIPVFAGASFRNIGVQPLLDAVVDLLPNPLERPDSVVSIENRSSTLSELLACPSAPVAKSKSQKSPSSLAVAEAKNIQACALAFKVVNDTKRGILVYVRVYHGSIDRGTILYNTNLQVAERAPRLLKMYANDAVEVDSIQTGQIGVITGLKHARTGDTLIVYKGLSVKSQPSSGLNSLQLRPIHVPPPVFFTSIEPHSLSEQKNVLDALAILLREDPSLHLSVDEESGQTHLAGMGDLHLEIARDRLLNDFKAKARIGKIEIGYRETVTTTTSPQVYNLDRTIAGKPAKASIIASVAPADEIQPLVTEPVKEKEDGEKDDEDPYTTYFPPTTDTDSNPLTIHHPSLSRFLESHPSLPPTLPPLTILTSLRTGVLAALSRGPLASYPLSQTHITLTFDASSHLYPETTAAALSMAARRAVLQCIREANEQSANALMEPVMAVRVFVNEGSLGSVVQDLVSVRGGQVLSLDSSESPSTSTSSSSSFTPDSQQFLINPAKIYAPPDPFTSSDLTHSTTNTTREIVARVPLKEMVGYLNHLRALTGGRGTFVMSVDGFEKMGKQRQKDVLEAMREFG